MTEILNTWKRDVLAQWGVSNQPYPGCPFCGAHVSLIGHAREGKLLHKCPSHGWVTPIPTHGLRP